MSVRVTPGASQNMIFGIEHRDDKRCQLRIHVTAPPDKNKANKAVIALVAKWLGIAKTAIIIKSGQTGRQKTLAIAVGTRELKLALKTLKS